MLTQTVIVDNSSVTCSQLPARNPRLESYRYLELCFDHLGKMESAALPLWYQLSAELCKGDLRGAGVRRMCGLRVPVAS